MSWKALLFTLSWLLVTYLGAFQLLLYNENFGNWMLEKYSEKPAEAKANFHQLLGFFQSAGYANFPEFTGDENRHMNDVRGVINSMSYALILGIIGVAVLWDRKLLKKTAGIGVIVPLLFLLIPFDALFDLFHNIFFPQGNWMFPAGSTITAYYTESFFAVYALWIVGTGWVVNLLVYVYHKIHPGKTRLPVQ